MARTPPAESSREERAHFSIRDRIIRLDRVRASSLIPHDKNFRTHPRAQREAFRDILDEIGFAGAVMARETKDGLVLIDGHLRVETLGDQIIPVLVTDLTEQEADALLKVFDAVGDMAGVDLAILEDLNREAGFASARLNQIVNELMVDGALSQVQAQPDSEERSLQQRLHAVKVVIQVSDLEKVEAAIKRAGTPNRGEALLMICEAYRGAEG